MKRPFQHNFLGKVLYTLRNLSCRAIFRELKSGPLGVVLDVGGRSFFQAACCVTNQFTRWIVIEPPGGYAPAVEDARYQYVEGDGLSLPILPESIDTAISIQVLEHVMEPDKMLSEISRVLKPNGKLICVVPQTSIAHGIPCHYYNFTRYWCTEILERLGFVIDSVQPIGGLWSTLAKRLFLFLLYVLGDPEIRDSHIKRPWLYYVLLPFMIPTSFILMPVFLLFSFGDIQEDACNHLIIAHKADTSVE